MYAFDYSGYTNVLNYIFFLLWTNVMNLFHTYKCYVPFPMTFMIGIYLIHLHIVTVGMVVPMQICLISTLFLVIEHTKYVTL